MSKTKISVASEVLAGTAQRVGLFVMGAAMVLSVLEHPDEAKRVILPSQPAPVWVGEDENSNNPIQREREEVAPHFISYSEVQRTASRSGRG